MNKFLLFIILNLILSNQFLLASEPLVAIKIEDKWTVFNNKNEILFSAGGISEFIGYSEGMIAARIIIEGKEEAVFFNENGEIQLRTDSDYATNFSDGISLIYDIVDPENEIYKLGFIKKDGTILKEKIYDDALKFSEGFAYVMNKNQRGYIDTNGNMALSFKDSLIGYSFKEGLSPVSNTDFKVGYIDKSGKVIIPFVWEMPTHFSEDLAIAMDTNTGKIGFINKYNVYEIRPSLDEATPFINNRAFAALYDQNYKPSWGLMLKTGKMITDLRFEDAKAFSENLAAVKFKGRWGFVDTTGNFAFSQNFTHVADFKNGIAFACDIDKDEYGYINKNGEYIIRLPKAEEYFDLQLHKSVYKKEK